MKPAAPRTVRPHHLSSGINLSAGFGQVQTQPESPLLFQRSGTLHRYSVFADIENLIEIGQFAFGRAGKAGVCRSLNLVPNSTTTIGSRLHCGVHGSHWGQQTLELRAYILSRESGNAS